MFTQGCKKRNEELTTVQYNASIIVDQLPSAKASECLLKKFLKSVHVHQGFLNHIKRVEEVTYTDSLPAV